MKTGEDIHMTSFTLPMKAMHEDGPAIDTRYNANFFLANL
jgi:hypothetical protein